MEETISIYKYRRFFHQSIYFNSQIPYCLYTKNQLTLQEKKLMTNGNAYSLLIAYSILANNDIKGLPFGVQRLANRNFKALYSIEEERQAIASVEGKTEDEKNEALQDFLSLPFHSNIEPLDEKKIEDVPNQSLPSGATTAQVFNTILDLQNK